MMKVIVGAVAACCAWVASGETIAVADRLRTEGPIVSRANEALGLTASTVARLELPAELDVAGMTVLVPLGDEPGTVMRLLPHSVRGDGFAVRAQLEDGTFVDVDPGPVRTIRGTVEGMPGSVVAASLEPTGLWARILTSDGGSMWIEPLGTRVAEADRLDHVIYADHDVIPSGGTCAATEAMGTEETSASRGVGNCGGLCEAELACDADVQFFNRYGSIGGVQQRIEGVINAMNVQYERDVDITHRIVVIVVRTAEPDPYSASDASPLLNQVRSWWQANGISQTPSWDVAQLFTGRNLSGSTIGIAWLRAVCTSNRYSVVESDCCGSFACATDLSAHELGHNWGSGHCSCSSPAYTMNPSIRCINRFSPNGTISTIVNFRTTRSCLDPGDPTKTEGPGEFALLSPANGAADVDTAPLLDWDDSANALNYTVIVDDSMNLATPLFTLNRSSSSLQISPGTLDEDTRYYWKVIANPIFGDVTTDGSPSLASFRTLRTGCPGDVNGDDRTNTADLSSLITQFGSVQPPGFGADLNGDGIINGADLSIIIGAFGCDER